MSTEEMINPESKKWLLKSAIIFFLILTLLVLSGLIFELSYRDRILPGLSLDGTELKGMRAEEFASLLDEKDKLLNQSGIPVSYQSERINLLPIMASANGEKSFKLYAINQDETLAKAFNFGRSGSILSDMKNQLSALVFGEDFKAAISLDETKIKEVLAGEFSHFDNPGKDAQLRFDADNDRFSINSEQSGVTINYDLAVKEIGEKLLRLDLLPLELSTVSTQPKIKKAQVKNLDLEAERVAMLAPLTFTASSSDDKQLEWTIPKATLANWLIIAFDSSNQPAVELSTERVKTYIAENISPKIEKPAEMARFEINNGKVGVFQSSQNGTELNLDENFTIINSAIISQKSSRVALATKEVVVDSKTLNNDLGVTEIIGTGHSNFAGSPKNRRGNIRVGADYLHGLIIQPGEIFSIMKHLGTIDKAGGYLQELVIKGNRTLPEYGGGLCQIGTTMFRAAINTGLPIVERRNHSYRVGYYEPAGTDATIYDPSPDLKFTNDTGNPILIQARIKNNDLYFDFWGTKDGRIATSTYPTIYNIVKPAPTKIIQSTELKPGEKKCTEKAHNGADAYFDYQVTYPNGELKKRRFSSHYVPWQEVCLVGASSASSSTPTTVSSSTTSRIGTTTPR